MAEANTKAFRGRRDKALFFLVPALFPIVFGAAGIMATGLEGACFFGIILLFGLFAVLAGVAILSNSVIVSEQGILKKGILKNGKYGTLSNFGWEEVECWTTGPVPWGDRMYEDSFTFDRAEFHLPEGRNTVVYDSEVSRPGFAEFLVAVREAIGEKERVEGQPNSRSK